MALAWLAVAASAQPQAGLLDSLQDATRMERQLRWEAASLEKLLANQAALLDRAQEDGARVHAPKLRAMPLTRRRIGHPRLCRAQ